MSQELLKAVSSGLLIQMRSAEGSSDFYWNKTQPEPHLRGRLVVIPSFDDGYMVFPEIYVWQSRRNNAFYAIGTLGVRKKFSAMDSAVEFILQV